MAVMRIPMTDYEQREPAAGTTELEFDKGAALLEGVNGWDRIDTHFENTERTQVLLPRGDRRGRPMPRDALFRGANNHGEWGNDTFQKKFERGMDGPISHEAYKGCGLPSREDLRPCANPQYDGVHAGVAGYPQDQGLNTKEV
jgi:hypothetical protein